MSIATELGFVVGKSYRTTGNEGNPRIPIGTIVTFKEDDLSHMPAFYCSKELDVDGWAYIGLDEISAEAISVETIEPADTAKPTTFSVYVAEASTSITVNKPLSAGVVAEILKLIGA